MMAKHAPKFLNLVNESKARVRELTVQDVKKRLDDQGVIRPADTSPEALAAVMKDYQDRMTKLIKAAGIKPE